MELVVGVLILFVLGQRPKATAQPQPEPEQSQEPTPGDVAKTLTEIAAIVPPVVAALKTIGGAVPPAAAAAVPAGAVLAGPVVVTLLANPFLWIVYVAIATIISKAQEEAKNFDAAVWRLGANARALCNYERLLFDEWTQHAKIGGALYRSEVIDYRLNWFWRTGGTVVLKGWRTVVDFVPAPPPKDGSPGGIDSAGLLTAYRRIRAAALVYLAERAALGAALLKTRLGKDAPQGFMLDAWARSSLHERLEPGLGGLDAVPLLDGKTLERRQSATEEAAPVAQLVAFDATPDFSSLALSDLQAARAAALLDAVGCFRYDQLLWLEGHDAYAAAIYDWLGKPAGVTVSGQNLITDADRYGATYSIDTRAAREGTSPMVRVLT